jgi:maltose O-acetyltransferase
MAPEKRLQKHNYADNILLGNNVWLGAGVIVLAGVSIGENSVVGAGSVVTKSLESNCFYAGNPAMKIRDL